MEILRDVELFSIVCNFKKVKREEENEKRKNFVILVFIVFIPQQNVPCFVKISLKKLLFKTSKVVEFSEVCKYSVWALWSIVSYTKHVVILSLSVVLIILHLVSGFFINYREFDSLTT